VPNFVRWLVFLTVLAVTITGFLFGCSSEKTENRFRAKGRALRAIDGPSAFWVLAISRGDKSSAAIRLQEAAVLGNDAEAKELWKLYEGANGQVDLRSNLMHSFMSGYIDGGPSITEEKRSDGTLRIHMGGSQIKVKPIKSP